MSHDDDAAGVPFNDPRIRRAAAPVVRVRRRTGVPDGLLADQLRVRLRIGRTCAVRGEP